MSDKKEELSRATWEAQKAKDDLIRTAAEFGFRMCEKGYSLQFMLHELDKTLGH